MSVCRTENISGTVMSRHYASRFLNTSKNPYAKSHERVLNCWMLEAAVWSARLLREHLEEVWCTYREDVQISRQMFLTLLLICPEVDTFRISFWGPSCSASLSEDSSAAPLPATAPTTWACTPAADDTAPFSGSCRGKGENQSGLDFGRSAAPFLSLRREEASLLAVISPRLWGNDAFWSLSGLADA